MKTALVLLLLAAPRLAAAQSPQVRLDRLLAGKATTAFGFIAAEADVKRGF